MTRKGAPGTGRLRATPEEGSPTLPDRRGARAPATRVAPRRRSVVLAPRGSGDRVLVAARSRKCVLDGSGALAPEILGCRDGAGLACTGGTGGFLGIGARPEGDQFLTRSKPVREPNDVVIDLDCGVAIALRTITVHQLLQTFFSRRRWSCPPFALLYLLIRPNLSQLANNEPN
jgi:hypothetical protein